MRTVALDVHKHFAEVAILAPGQGIRRHRIDTTPSGLRELAERLRPDDQVVLESTFNTWAIAELLRAQAGKVVVSNPMRTKAIASAKVKTDKVDAAILAQLMAADFIPEVWVPDPLTRRLRRQVSHRRGLVQQQTRLRNRIHGVLLRNLVECPYSDVFGKGGRQWLAELALPAEERQQVDSALRLLAGVETELEEVDRTLAEDVVVDRRVRHLLSIPGVGLMSALALVAVVGDISRFPRPNQLVGYLGLDPRVRQSGDRPAYTGSISRQGQAHARGLLIEAAHASVRVPGPLHAFYERIRSRRGKQIAYVAVARKLAVLTWHLLTKGVDYQWSRQTLTASKLRQLELQAGQPKRYRSRAGSGPPLDQVRAQEQQVLRQAEEAYRTMVAARRERADAAASHEERLMGSRPDARRRSHPLPPLFSTRADRAQPEHRTGQHGRG